MGMSIDEATLYMELYKRKLFNSVSDLDKDIEAYDTAIETMRKYQEIIDKYEMLCDSFIGLDGETVTKKIDEFCIDTMRGLLGEHYSDALHEVVEDGKID